MKTRKIPMRRCVGCMESKPKKELVRIVCTLQGELMLDYTGKANGRGVYLCPNAECISKARKKKAVGRGFERELEPEQLERIFEELSAYEGENP
ncbi:MAG TPA: YlxR family protein [Bacillota bacterium]|nr:YlxR family protein [Bacillota bacterium]